MVFNGINLSNYNARLLKVDVQPSTFDISSFKTNYHTNIVGKITNQGKILTVEIKVDGNDRDKILQNVSKIISNFKVGTIKLQKYSHLFTGELIKSNVSKTIIDKSSILELQYLCYEHEEVKNYSSSSNVLSFTVTGTDLATVVFEITPQSNASIITMKSPSFSDISIHNVLAGQKVIMDGDKQLVTVNGINKFGETNMSYFPTFSPGSHTITFGGVSVINVLAKVKNIWT